MSGTVVQYSMRCVFSWYHARAFCLNGHFPSPYSTCGFFRDLFFLRNSLVYMRIFRYNMRIFSSSMRIFSVYMRIFSVSMCKKYSTDEAREGLRDTFWRRVAVFPTIEGQCC